MEIPESISKLSDSFCGLPGIGKRSASRIVFHLLQRPAAEVSDFAAALLDLKKKVFLCSGCFNYTETDPCPVCKSGKRDRSVICVLEKPTDMLSIEKSGMFRGLYHILGGAVSPIDGVQPSDLRIKELIERCRGGEVSEIIMATSLTQPGETTAMYIGEKLKDTDIKISRLARGIPEGSDLEFVDEITLFRALQHRTEF